MSLLASARRCAHPGARQVRSARLRNSALPGLAREIDGAVEIHSDPKEVADNALSLEVPRPISFEPALAHEVHRATCVQPTDAGPVPGAGLGARRRHRHRAYERPESLGRALHVHFRNHVAGIALSKGDAGPIGLEL